MVAGALAGSLVTVMGVVVIGAISLTSPAA